MFDWLEDKLGETVPSVLLGGVLAVALCAGIVGFVIIVVPAESVHADAQHPPRPEPTPEARVELVKLFGCSRGTSTAGVCSDEVEAEANIWLQSKQPWIRIKDRQLRASEIGLFLIIFYEVPAWDKAGKPPAEAPR